MKRHSVLSGLLIALSGLAGGCHNRAWALKRAERCERRHRIVDRHVDYHLNGPERIEHLHERHCRLEVKRAANAQTTRDFIRSHIEQNADDTWGDGACRRDEKIRKWAHGQPETIPKTLSKITY